MRKQTVILSIWLTLPFLALTLLMAWLFTSLDKDRLMQDAPPVGAGAGDTGNANALGQWLAGRDPDQISKANQARREGTAVNPFNWPGGTLITFEHFPTFQQNDLIIEARIVIEVPQSKMVKWRTPNKLDGNRWGILLKQQGNEILSLKIAVGYQSVKNKELEWPFTHVPMTPIHPGETLSTDPIEISIDLKVVEP